MFCTPFEFTKLRTNSTGIEPQLNVEDAFHQNAIEKPCQWFSRQGKSPLLSPLELQRLTQGL